MTRIDQPLQGPQSHFSRCPLQLHRKWQEHDRAACCEYGQRSLGTSYTSLDATTQPLTPFLFLVHRRYQGWTWFLLVGWVSPVVSLLKVYELTLALFLRHMPVSRDNCRCSSKESDDNTWHIAGPLVFDAIRAVHPTTPILILGGHTHIRDCSTWSNVYACPGAYTSFSQFSLMAALWRWKVGGTWRLLVR